MILKHTLTKGEYKAFIDREVHGVDYPEEFGHVNELHQSSIYWDRKICGLNHLLTVVIEQLVKADRDPKEIIEFIYNLPDQCHFEIQETSEWFIDELFLKTLQNGLELEDYLIIVQDSLP